MLKIIVNSTLELYLALVPYFKNTQWQILSLAGHHVKQHEA
jgi:hypothetical protein